MGEIASSAFDLPPDAQDPRGHAHLIGHAHARAALDMAIQEGRMPHAWILSGPKGIGKATLAWHYARTLLEGEARAQDGHVLARYADANHPRLVFIHPPEDEKGGYKNWIPVETIRALGDRLHLAAEVGEWRVVIIDPAEAMNSAAANALLKMLEEPPAQVVFFLVSHTPQQLLPTIRSRCRMLGLQALSIEEIKTAWALLSDEPLSELHLRLAGGSLYNVFAWDDDFFQSFHHLWGIVSTKRPLDRLEIIKWVDELLKNRTRTETLDRALRLFELCFAQGLRVFSGEEADIAEAGFRIAPSHYAGWAILSFRIMRSLGEARRLNLDAASVIMQSLFEIDQFLADAG